MSIPEEAEQLRAVASSDTLPIGLIQAAEEQLQTIGGQVAAILGDRSEAAANINGDLEQQLGDAVSDGRITTGDADTIREFRDFLREIGPASRPVRRADAPVLLKYADLLGLSDEQRARLERTQR